MKNETSESFFTLIDSNGHRCVPRKINARDGRYGYAIHPIGKSNDASAANYTEDERVMVEAVVLHGFGVRTVTMGGAQDGQRNTHGLSKGKISSYWLCPSRANWVVSAKTRPVNDK